jgi:hypothetical protein
MTAVRSLLAPWVGGASLPVSTPGYRSLLAFWAGGAVVGQQATPPVLRGGGRYYVPQRLRRDYREQLIDEDELLLLMAAEIVAGVLH